MRLLWFVLVVCIVGLVKGNEGPKTLVLMDDTNIEKTHSTFFKSLSDRGHRLDFREVYDEDTKLEKYGEYFYDNLIIFAPSAEDFGEGMSIEKVVSFIDSGRNVMVAVNSNVSEPIREIANECGVDFDEENTRVIDHMSFDHALDDGSHTTVIVSASSSIPSVILPKKSINPILFNGIGHAAAEGSRLISKVVTGNPTTYSHTPNKIVVDYPQSAGADTLLLTAVQTRNNARVVFTGSLDLFSDKFFAASVTRGEGSPIPSGNKDLCVAVSEWNFAERGLLRASPFTYKKVDGDMGNLNQYRIKDTIAVSVLIEEYDGKSKSWKPFTANDVQLEFVMIDPYVRITLKHDGKGTYSTSFMVPDVYGVFKLVLSYTRAGFSNLEVVATVPVHPFRHNQFERFIDVAYPYYLSAFSCMGAFFVFGLLFMYSGDGQEK